MEYLWHDLNKRDLNAAVTRVFREVAFDPNAPARLVTDFIPDLITRGENGETLEQTRVQSEREAARFDRWVARRRERDAQDAEFQQELENEFQEQESDDRSPVVSRPTRSTARNSRATAPNPPGAGRPPSSQRTRGTRSSSRRSSRR
jgi:hypothetical protein